MTFVSLSLFLTTGFIAYTVCLYNTPWYIRNLKVTSKTDGKAFNVSIINFVHIPNKMLLMKPIAWLTASSVKECRSKCTALPTCISLNARRIIDVQSQTSDLHCDFFDDDHYANKLFLIDADDVDYYAPKVTNKTTCRFASLLLIYFLSQIFV